MQYQLSAQRVDATGSLASSHGAEVRLATDMEGRKDAPNPVELLLAALAACMIKGAERVLPVLKFQLDGMRVSLQADRQDAPPRLAAIRYEITIDTPESAARLDLLHRNILKYGTISNTLAAAVPLSGTIRRAGDDRSS
ncbi:OsmC family protein [Rhodobacter calidifons]|uniref:OsmC family protein n=1 Tax=Rhodobacter calidifons TaxID=2715277 RepID=A0ABX0G4P8_9RHOB|nr:OsmC family protein [Rhodobacter calidifons]NHB75839.1 OsmC family protein [Rhodobacter calidifons]